MKNIIVTLEVDGEETQETFNCDKYRPYLSSDGVLLIILKKSSEFRIIKKAYAKGFWNSVVDESL